MFLAIFFSSFSLCRFQSSGGIAGWAGARQLASEISREWSAFVDLEITQDGAGCASVFDNKKIREIFSVVTMKWDHPFVFFLGMKLDTKNVAGGNFFQGFPSKKNLCRVVGLASDNPGGIFCANLLWVGFFRGV